MKLWMLLWGRSWLGIALFRKQLRRLPCGHDGVGCVSDWSWIQACDQSRRSGISGPKVGEVEVVRPARLILTRSSETSHPR